MIRLFKLTFAAIVLVLFLAGCSSNMSQANENVYEHTYVKQNQDTNVPAEPAKVEESPQASAPTVYQELQLVDYQGDVEHIFFHPLIVYPQLAFDNDRLAQGYQDWFVTVKEFNRVLEQLYQKGFVLIDTNYLYEEKMENGQKVLVKKEQLLLPPNKQPMIISIDDLNYYDYMIENGNAHKLVLDQDGNIATYSLSPQGEAIVSRDNEIIPILDKFVEEHPDFSFQGAKGLLALTGYQGILGYRTRPDALNHQQEIEAVRPVIKGLQATGWTFASHGWGHLDAKKTSNNSFVKDTLRWKEEVASLVGPTKIYVYPYGSSVPVNSPKFQFLLDSGFNVIYSVGPVSYSKYTSQYILMDRRRIDGMAMLKQSSRLMDLIDSSQVLDEVR